MLSELKKLHLIEEKGRDLIFFSKPELDFDNLSSLYKFVGVLPREN